MKLRTKLLLGVGVLLFAMAIIMYILPTFFVRKEIFRAADEIHELLISEHQQLIRSQQLWLEDTLEGAKENNDALLFMLYEAPNFRSDLSFNDYESAKNILLTLSRIIGYDPNIGFVQAHSPELQKTAIINLSAATLYPVDKITKQGDAVTVSLLMPNLNKRTQSFIGVALPAEFQKEDGFTLYALIDPKEVKEQSTEVHEEIELLMPEFIQKWLSPINHLSLAPDQKNKFAFQWAVKANMIRTLTPLYFEGLKLTKNTARVPEGLVRVDQTNNGYAILSEDIFSSELLFDDEHYYKLHLPSSGTSHLANGVAIIADPHNELGYIGNTILIDTTYFTIGTSLDFLARQLALSSNRIVLLRVNQQFWIGYDGQGNKMSTDTINELKHEADLQQKNGIIETDRQSYFFTQLSSLEDNRLVFFDFRPVSGETSIVSPLFNLEDKLTHRISMQLVLISIGTMILVLIFIGRIGFTVIYPVTKLAAATQCVVAGRYTDVVLPDVSDRQDEVAILTRSFADMVTGLQEREKIRAVLDKVVSKDVADEILRTNIHLGGEDRIVTMLFCDVRGFASLTAHLTPQETIHLLNVCMTKVSRVIESEGGVIDKYVGDEVMAIFGAPTAHPDHALRAVSTGMLIVETLKKWNLERIAEGKPAIEMGIGIHTGLVVAGNMGAEDRLNYTVLGTNVNLAARLCEVAKPNQLIISEATLFEPNIKESFYTMSLAPLNLKGFIKPVNIYEISGFKWDES